MTPQQANLKPCPFCNADLLPFGTYQHNHPVNDCWLASVSIKAHEDDAWNRRAPAPTEPAVDRDAVLEEAALACEALRDSVSDGPGGSRMDWPVSQNDCIEAIRAMIAAAPQVAQASQPTADPKGGIDVDDLIREMGVEDEVARIRAEQFSQPTSAEAKTSKPDDWITAKVARHLDLAYRNGVKAGWNAGMAGDGDALKRLQNLVGIKAEYAELFPATCAPAKPPKLGEYRTCCDHPDCTQCAGRGGFYRVAAQPGPTSAEGKGSERLEGGAL